MNFAGVRPGDQAANTSMRQGTRCNASPDINSFEAIDMISSLPKEVGQRIVGMLPSNYVRALLQGEPELAKLVSSWVRSAKANTNRAELISLKRFPFLRTVDIRATYELTKEDIATILTTQQLQEVRMRTDQLGVTSAKDRMLCPVTSLAISGCLNFSDEAIHRIADFPELESLDMQYCLNRPSIIDFIGLQQISHLNLSSYANMTSLDKFNLPTSLKTLNLSRCTRLRDLEALRGTKKLTSLDLSWTVLQSTSSLSVLNRLKRIQLVGCQIDDLTASLSRMPSIEELDLSRVKSPLDVRSLFTMSNLKKLSLSECSHVEGLELLFKLSSLKSIDLTRCELPILFRGFPSEIEDLNLSSNRNIISLDHLGELRNLRHLNLSGCTHLKDIDSLQYSTELQTLNLRNCTSIQNFSVIKSLKKLKMLTLNGCRDHISDNSLSDIVHRLNMGDVQVQGFRA